MRGQLAELRGLPGQPAGVGLVERRRDEASDSWATLGLLLSPLLLAVGLVWWLVRHPVSTITVTASVLTWNAGGGWALLTSAVVVVSGLVVWRWRHRASFTRLVTNKARAGCRGWWCYRRRWRAAMTLTGLSARFDRDHYLPRIRSIRSDRHADRVSVRMLSGQAVDDYEKHAAALANSFDAISCRVRQDRPGRVSLDFVRRDPLAPIIPALDPPAVPDLAALPIGLQEDGQPWTLRLLGTHILIGGATGSGKGSIIWSLNRALGPLISAGTVALWVVDPKGGMELTSGWPCYTRYACNTPDTIADLLDDAEHLVRERAARLRGVTRQHTPTPADPLVVVVVDELAKLTAYLLDRDARRRITASLSVILTQGRAVGVTVVAAVQDVHKEIVPFRDLFPTRIALRMTEPAQADMILGQGAHTRGALCERIPMTQPGIGYVLLDGHREPTRVRAAHVTDTDITDLTHRFPAPSSVARACDVELAAVMQQWTHEVDPS